MPFQVSHILKRLDVGHPDHHHHHRHHRVQNEIRRVCVRVSWPKLIVITVVVGPHSRTVGHGCHCQQIIHHHHIHWNLELAWRRCTLIRILYFFPEKFPFHLTLRTPCVSEAENRTISCSILVRLPPRLPCWPKNQAATWRKLFSVHEILICSLTKRALSSYNSFRAQNWKRFQ